MKTIRNAFLAVLAIFAGAFAADDGIEVLSITQTSTGFEYLVSAPAAPIGSYAEGIMLVDGIEVLAAIAPVDPVSQTATVEFPIYDPNNQVRIRQPDGTLFSTAGYDDVVTYD